MQQPSERFASDAKQMGRDPLGYLRECLQRCQECDQYSLVLYRQERLGLIPTLREPERIRVLYRATPLSIKMVWLQPPDSEALASLYVEGQHDGRMLLLPRRGPFGLPASVGQFDPRDPVLWGKAVRPMTEFGLARMLERTLEAIRRAEGVGRVSIAYLGLKDLDHLDQPVHHLRIDYPTGGTERHGRQDLFMGAATRLPAGTFLWLPNGQLDAVYLYSDLNRDAKLQDADFSIDREVAGARP